VEEGGGVNRRGVERLYSDSRSGLARRKTEGGGDDKEENRSKVLYGDLTAI
jgi:hypothetical protein